MKKILEILKVVLPILLGIWLIVHFYNKLSAEEKDQMYVAISGANYIWIFTALAIGMFSHFIRALRWQYLLEPLGYKPKVLNSYFSVLIGYAANLLLPRLGEASRCAYLDKYEKVPFNKSFGTVIAERIVDVIVLFLIIGLTVFLQLQLIAKSEEATKIIETFSKQASALNLIIGVLGIVVFSFLAYWVFKWLSTKPKIKKITDFIKGFFQGITSVLKMKNKGLFIFYSLLIWLCYVIMFWACFFSIEQTANVPIAGVLLSFVFGSFAVIIVQGGIGVFPIAIMQALVYYNISAGDGMALGWLAWLVQTIGYLFFGLLSLILMPIYNRYLHAKLASDNSAEIS